MKRVSDRNLLLAVMTLTLGFVNREQLMATIEEATRFEHVGHFAGQK